MKKTLKKCCAAVGLCAVVFSGILLCQQNSVLANAEEYDEVTMKTIQTDGECDPLGIYTSLTVSLDHGKGQVWATAQNAFTLFPATVRVYVQLYSSDCYRESYTEMTLVSQEYTGDLNMGDSISAYASTNGVQKYWLARIYYKVDNKNWSSQTTEIELVDGNGNEVII